MKKVIFTDLDGTLIDHRTYSYKDSIGAVNILKKKEIPIVICTSKTRAEIEKYRSGLKIDDPFISENGSAIFIPNNYFPFPFPFNRQTPEYRIIELGTSIKSLLKTINKIKDKGYKITTFSGMSVEELSGDSGLSTEEAACAKMREYDEAFKITHENEKHKILDMIKKDGYNYTAGGRYYHIMGKSDKGKAVLLLTRLFRRKYKEQGHEIKTIGLGDSQNDIPMLKQVDHPVLVKNSANPEPEADFAVTRTELEGPKGWSRAVEELLSA